jgi:hypothetical protein
MPSIGIGQLSTKVKPWRLAILAAMRLRAPCVETAP